MASNIIGGHTTVTTEYKLTKDVLTNLIAKELDIPVKELTVTFDLHEASLDDYRPRAEFDKITVKHVVQKALG